MEALKDIFVSYDIAVQLKEIGFDKPCIASYDMNDEIQFIIEAEEYLLDKKYAKGKATGSNYAGFSAPTYEQVKKWFREKGTESSLFTEDGYYYYRGSKGDKFLFSGTESSYEQAREQLIYKLIEFYKNGCKR